LIHESIIQFIWKYQAFDHRSLRTDRGETLQVIHPGTLNLNAGPDFQDAIIRINELEWNGSVEIHIRSSDWHVHRHSGDPAYQNVVLHVVWQNTGSILRNDGSPIPTFQIADWVRPDILTKYSRISDNVSHIPCLSHPVSANAFRSALERAFETRLRSKSKRIFDIWHKSNMDWEQTAFAWMCRHMGFKVNNEVFEVLGLSVPYRILQKHRDRPDQVEALVFGMAGLLESGFEKDDYWNSLRKEFRFLSYKYNLKPRIKAHEWKFLRLRPDNFPTVRLAQLSAILIRRPSLFNWLLDSFNKDSELRVSGYWQQHYYFGKMTDKAPGFMGEVSWQHLWMNVVPPLQYSLAVKRGSSTQHIAAAFGSLKAENNRITRRWEKAGVYMETALDSQSYYALFQQGCKLRKCLECPVGIELLKSA
jgi:hypothetical protein